MDSRRTRLVLEELDGRVLPSATPLPVQFRVFDPNPTPPVVQFREFGPVTVAGLAHLQALTALASPALRGSGTGSYTNDVNNGTGLKFHLAGHVHLPGLGHFHLTGALHGPGNALNARAGGRLVLSNGSGTITLALAAPGHHGHQRLPHLFDYTVVAATGGYQPLAAHAALRVALEPQGDTAGTFSVKFA